MAEIMSSIVYIVPATGLFIVLVMVISNVLYTSYCKRKATLTPEQYERIIMAVLRNVIRYEGIDFLEDREVEDIGDLTEDEGRVLAMLRDRVRGPHGVGMR